MDRRIKQKIAGADRVYRKALLDFERSWWNECLARNGGRVSAAAREAGELRCVVYKLLADLGITPSVQRHRGNWGDLTD